VSEWQTFLRARGARFDGDAVVDFGEPEAELRAARSGEALADLSHQGLVAVSGRDAGALLQGQQTGDVRDVDGGHSQLSGLCSTKGRLIATYRTVLRGDRYLLVLPRELAASVAGRLRMYVLRSDARVAEATGELVLLGLLGAGVAGRARDLLGGLPDTPDAVRESGLHSVVALPGRRPRFLVMTPPGEAPGIWEALAAVGRPIGRAAWTLAEIEAGVPEVVPETADSFVPQMVNYQALRGVSFTKGCYTGQEVVARTQYLGRLKRRMYRAQVGAPRPPRPGEDLYSPADALGQSVGKVVTAAPDPDGGYALLAVIQNEAVEAPVHLGSPDGPLLALGELPYPV
jgi:hypothetical protein